MSVLDGPMTNGNLLLTGLRVVDMADAAGEAAARLLADLGADVVKVEPPGGLPARGEGVRVGGAGLAFALRNAGKRAVAADIGTARGRGDVEKLLRDADVLFADLRGAEALDVDALTERLPRLVVVVSSPFGRRGPRSGWQATERTLLALSGSMSRSGRPGDVPLLPPDGIATATAAAHAAWAALVAHAVRRRTGRGQVVDLSQHESLVVGLDPAFGVQGSAAAGRPGRFDPGRPPADSYPIFRCADGHVRLCLLAKRQWRGMFAWLGEPEEFADPAYDSIRARMKAKDRLNPLIAALFAGEPAAALVEEAARRGVPLAQVLSMGEALGADHFTKAGSVAAVEVAPGTTITAPTGFAEVDGRRLGLRGPCPPVPAERAGTAAWSPRGPVPAVPAVPGAPPFAGLRVLDLGVIVFGAEVGRAFADLGADVIKVESTAFPDGLRQTLGGGPMSASFAWGNRNKRSLGLDLRTDEGREIFLDLAERSDVVLSNFKPGTLGSLGIGHDALSARNPGIVVLESPAFGSRGPWSNRLGYGPLVRAACGVTSLWKYDADDVESWDGVTVYPDHVAARLGAVLVAAALLARESDGRGRHLEIAQSDVVLYQLAAFAALEGLRPGAVRAVGNRGREPFGGVFACAGDDEWAVVDARTAGEVETLRTVVGAATDAELTGAVATWCGGRTPGEVTETLQAAGLPAAGMVRLPQLLDDPQLQARGTYATLTHPLLGDALPAEDVRAPFGHLPLPGPGPAPLSGEHTAGICAGLLGMEPSRLRELLDRGVLQRRSR